MKQGVRALARSVASETSVSLGTQQPGSAAAKAQELRRAEVYPKPFHKIPGPKPSLPFIGTSWQYSKWGNYQMFSLLLLLNVSQRRRTSFINH